VALLEAYIQFGTVTHASQAVGIGRRTHYDWLAADPAYAGAFADAKDAVADAYELEVKRRAIEGVDEPVFYKGEICGHVRKFSDLLLIFMLKALRPGKYRETVNSAHSGKVTLEALVAASRLPEHDHA
jgi:hypothetical protein